MVTVCYYESIIGTSCIIYKLIFLYLIVVFKKHKIYHPNQ